MTTLTQCAVVRLPARRDRCGALAWIGVAALLALTGVCAVLWFVTVDDLLTRAIAHTAVWQRLTG